MFCQHVEDHFAHGAAGCAQWMSQAFEAGADAEDLAADATFG
jgi:hypothetical protein